MRVRESNLVIFNNNLINGFFWGLIDKIKEISNYFNEVTILDIAKKKLGKKPLKYNIWQK